MKSIVKIGGPDLLEDRLSANVIGLMAVTHAAQLDRKDHLTFEQLWSKHMKLHDNLNDLKRRRLVHWHALWRAPEDLILDEDEELLFPGISWFANIATTNGAD